MSRLCRTCLHRPGQAAARCPNCGSPRVLDHPELDTLSIAHIDCDAFYASVEKRDRPALRDKPVIVGGGHRGVVSAACYIARMHGVRSAMPMYRALKACPDAVVLRPDIAKYSAVGKQVRQLMLAVTPLVEPISIDEAFLDLTGTDALHGGSPAHTLARLIKRIEDDLGLTASVGLSYNKFLAKIASDLDKPRGFAIIGRAEALDFLDGKPVSIIWGVGKALQRKLARDSITLVRHLGAYEEAELVARYGTIGRRLHRFAQGKDDRRVEPTSPTKSISAETTFDIDLTDPQALLARLWPLCEKVSLRLKQAGLAGHGVTLKLKTADFRQLTRSSRLDDPTQLAEVIYRTAEPMIRREAAGRAFRLIGIGAGDLVDSASADPENFLDSRRQHEARVEKAIDAVRAKLGGDAIIKGRSLAEMLNEKPQSSPSHPRKTGG